MDSSHDGSARGSDVSVSLAELKTRLHALQEDKGHYVELAAKANTAFEAHRIELTQLRQKERAVFVANEDRLRSELQAVLSANRVLMERLESQRQAREAALQADLLDCRRHGNTQLVSLQSEVDALWLERRAAEAETLRLSVEQERAQAALAEAMQTQGELHNTLQYAKQAAQEELDEALLAEERASTRASRGGGCRCCCGCGDSSRSPLLADGGRPSSSPGRVPRAFIPSGPKTQGGEADTVCRSRPWEGWRGYCTSPIPRCGRCRNGHHRRFTSLSRRHRGVSPATQTPLHQQQPASHNAQAILSTIQRGNYLRPREYLERQAQARYSHDDGGDAREAAGMVEPEDRGPGASPLRERLEGMRRQHTARKGAVRATCPIAEGAPHAPCHASPSPPPPLVSSWSRQTTLTPPPPLPPPPPGQSNRSHDSPSHRSLSPPTPERHRSAADTTAIGSPSSSPRRQHQQTPPPPPRSTTTPALSILAPTTATPYNTTSSGRAISAACETILAELQELREDYAECHRRLRDPKADSVEASRDMRRVLAVMDRKADQLRTLRSEQRVHGDKLRTRDMIGDVLRENAYCEGVYGDIVHLIRS